MKIFRRKSRLKPNSNRISQTIELFAHGQVRWVTYNLYRSWFVCGINMKSVKKTISTVDWRNKTRHLIYVRMWEEHVKTRKAGWLRVRKSNTRSMLIRMHVYHMCVCVCNRASVHSRCTFRLLMRLCWFTLECTTSGSTFVLFQRVIRSFTCSFAHTVSRGLLFTLIYCVHKTSNAVHSAVAFRIEQFTPLPLECFLRNLSQNIVSPSVCWCLVLFRFDYFCFADCCFYLNPVERSKRKEFL